MPARCGQPPVHRSLPRQRRPTRDQGSRFGRASSTVGRIRSVPARRSAGSSESSTWSNASLCNSVLAAQLDARAWQAHSRECGRRAQDRCRRRLALRSRRSCVTNGTPPSDYATGVLASSCSARPSERLGRAAGDNGGWFLAAWSRSRLHRLVLKKALNHPDRSRTRAAGIGRRPIRNHADELAKRALPVPGRQGVGGSNPPCSTPKLRSKAARPF